MTYRQIANQFGLTLCSDCEARGSHERGFIVGNTIHWRERRMQRVGLRRFLIAVSRTRFKLAGVDKATELHARNQWAVRMARGLGLSIPARYSVADRAKARWLIHRYGLKVDAAVRQWATRRSTHAKANR